MKKKDEKIKSKRKEKKADSDKRKKEFKIEIVKVGKLEENTAGRPVYNCEDSDRNVKENFDLVDRRDILARLASISVETWNYKFQRPSIRHIGPMAQEFAAAFNVGEDDRHINMVDAFGVALASIQALYEMIQEKDAKITALEQRLKEL
ncbi:MAG TPA: tail fiber domain-containing protein [Thermodesulfobacteriota bacterium]|nr:tail fiber domain-containing protein [Thermodesulfobacteriota bacterium]